MALTDVNFSEGEGQDFVVEVPSAVYTGTITDALFEPNSTQYPVNEIPAQEGGSNVFIITE
ncbi:MAG: hypothetical protein KBD50_00900 [Candidatus Pacebacteria bacterium]|nr:hypothetical protein [Candidatus Paceibacterota bacterium]